MNQLFSGATIQVDDILLTDWSLVSSKNVVLTDVFIGAGYGGTVNEAGLLTQNHALQATGSEDIDLYYSFMATSVSGAITGLDEILGFRRYDTVQGYNQGSIIVGTAKGLNNLGTTTSRHSPNSGNYNGTPIDIPDLKSVWVTTYIDIFGGSGSQFAELGYVPSSGYGPGYRYAFSVGEAPNPTIPEPGTLGLLALGCAGLICLGRKRGYY